MKIAIGTIDITDDQRRGVASFHGRHGELATRDEIRKVALQVIGHALDIHARDYAKQEIARLESLGKQLTLGDQLPEEDHGDAEPDDWKDDEEHAAEAEAETERLRAVAGDP